VHVDNLLDYVELLRIEAVRQLTDEHRAALAQYDGVPDALAPDSTPAARASLA
jgi:hypothetical protein